MKRLSIFVIAFFLLSVVSGSAVWADATLSLQNPDSGDGNWTAPSPSTLTITLLMTNTVPIRGGQFDIEMSDPNAISLTSAEPAGALANLTDPDVSENPSYSANSARVLFFDYDAGTIPTSSGEGGIIELNFSIQDGLAEGTTIDLNFASTDLIIVSNDGVETTTTTGTQVVIGGVQTYDVDFVSGWNMFGLPLDPAADWDSYSFINNTNNCTQVARYVGGTFETAIDLGGFIVGPQFTLEPGIGYFAYCDDAEMVTFEGEFFATPQTSTFGAGWSMISVPNDGDGDMGNAAYDSYALINAISECTQVAKFEGGSFQVAIDLGGFIVGPQFDIVPGEGYFIFTSAAGSWTPDPPRSSTNIHDNNNWQADKASQWLNRELASQTKTSTRAFSRDEKGASQSALIREIGDVYVTNRRATQATFSWPTTGELTSTRVDYGSQSGNLDQNVEDPTLTELHYINAMGLEEFSTYFYTASSNGETTPEASFMSAKDFTATPYVAAGVVNDQGGSPAEGVIAYLQVRKSSGATSWVESQLTISQGGGTPGSFVIDMNGARNPADGLAFNPAPGDSIDIWIEGGSLGTYSGSFGVVAGFVNVGTLTLTPPTAEEPEYEAAPTSLAFNNVVNGMSATQTFTITNIGNAAGTVTSITSDNADFTTDFAGNVNLNPAGTVDVEVTYSPSEVAGDTGTLTIATDANQVTVDVTGTGVAQPTLTAGSAQAEPGGTATVSVSLDNAVPIAGVEFTIGNGDGNLTIDSAATTSRTSGFNLQHNDGMVILTPSAQAQIDAGTGAILEFSYTVNATTCADDYTLTITSSDLTSTDDPAQSVLHQTAEGTFTVLSIPAVFATDAPEDTLHMFAPDAQTTADSILHVLNAAPDCQGEDLTVTDITISGADADVFDVIDPTTFPIEVTAGGSIAVTVRLDGTSNGVTYYASLDFATSVGAQSITLEGEVGDVAIELLAFNAIDGVGEVTLNWEVADNSDIIGFNVYRQGESDMEPVKVNGNYVMSATGQYTYTDEVLGGVSYEYWIEGVEVSGEISKFESVYASPAFKPTTFKLTQNYPNPFNPSTTIMFDVPEDTHVSIRVYNVNGQLVRTLYEQDTSVGQHRVVWDAKDNNGRDVTSGVYFYRLEAPNKFTTTKRMMLMK